MIKSPIPYECCDCGVEGVKLWREYNTFLENQSLKCRTCSEKEAAPARERRRHENPAAAKLMDEMDTDTIGWRVPAVPTEDGSTFWGYTSVPEGRALWWYALPG